MMSTFSFSSSIQSSNILFGITIKKQEWGVEKSDHLLLFLKSRFTKKLPQGKRAGERRDMCPETVFLVKQVKMTAEMSSKAHSLCALSWACLFNLRLLLESICISYLPWPSSFIQAQTDKLTATQKETWNMTFLIQWWIDFFVFFSQKKNLQECPQRAF